MMYNTCYTQSRALEVICDVNMDWTQNFPVSGLVVACLQVMSNSSLME